MRDCIIDNFLIAVFKGGDLFFTVLPDKNSSVKISVRDANNFANIRTPLLRIVQQKNTSEFTSYYYTRTDISTISQRFVNKK